MVRFLALISLGSLFVSVGCARPPEGSDAGVTDASSPVAPCNGECTADESCDSATNTCVLALASKCKTTGTAPWAAGTQAFVDSTVKWGLSSPISEGTRISSTDIDGDGLDDLAIRKVGNTRDDPSDPTKRSVWLLHNTGSTFEDVTASSGILANRTDTTATVGRPAEILVFADVDNDGDTDVFTGASGTTPETSELLLNDGKGHFTLAPPESEFRRTNDSLGGASFVDVNLDGKIDLWLGGSADPVSGSGTQDRLYLGDGKGTFYEETDRAGLTTKDWSSIADLNAGLAHTISWGTAACDLNGDGFPELLSSSYGRAPNHLWQAQGLTDGIAHYENRSVASGYAYDMGMDWTDNESARCWCHLHRTDPDCANVPDPMYIQCTTDADAFRWNHDYDRNPFRLGGNTGTTVCGDVNGDGKLDLLNLEIVHWDVGSSSDPSQLLINSGTQDVHFDRPGNAATGLTRPHTIPWDDGDITGALFDFDNDGRLDVLINSTDYPGTRVWLYHQNANGTFDAVPITDGIDHQSAHGVAVADFDRDGDLDLVIGHSRNRCNLGTQCYPQAHARFFENVLGNGAGNWVQLLLEGASGSNRSAIGARVTVKTDARTQTFEVGGGHGHYGIQHDFVIHAGLGSACEAEVTIRWPDAAHTTQTFKVPAGYRFHVTQGGRPQPVK